MAFDVVWRLPVIFAALLGLSSLLSVLLDGLDLGVGLLFPVADDHERDRTIGSLGPCWDGNETWPVLAAGLLLVAFPAANGAILTTLYPLVAAMAIGPILRGVAFEFRAKAPSGNKPLWNRAFFLGSMAAASPRAPCLAFMSWASTSPRAPWPSPRFPRPTPRWPTASRALPGGS